MNNREKLIAEVEGWIRDTKERGIISDGAVIGSILNPYDFRPDSDIDLILASENNDNGTVHVALRSLQMDLQHNIDALILESRYLKTFSPLYKKSSLLLGLFYHDDSHGLVRSLHPFFHQENFMIFWRCHLALRRVRLHLKDRDSEENLLQDLQRDAAYVNLFIQKKTLKSSIPVSLNEFHLHERDFDSIMSWIWRNLEDQHNELLSYEAVPLPVPLEEFMHIDYWKRREIYNAASESSKLVQALFKHSDDLRLEISHVRGRK